jgi:hypothetical protein
MQEIQACLGELERRGVQDKEIVWAIGEVNQRQRGNLTQTYEEVIKSVVHSTKY